MGSIEELAMDPSTSMQIDRLDRAAVWDRGSWKLVKNLGWLLDHAGDVDRFEVRLGDSPTSRDVVLIAFLDDGRIYATPFASRSVLAGWLCRPVFKGLGVRWIGTPRVLNDRFAAEVTAGVTGGGGAKAASDVMRAQLKDFARGPIKRRGEYSDGRGHVLVPFDGINHYDQRRFNALLSRKFIEFFKRCGCEHPCMCDGNGYHITEAGLAELARAASARC